MTARELARNARVTRLLGTVAVALGMFAVGCSDLFVDPAPGSTNVALRWAAVSDGSSADPGVVYDKADHVRVRVSGGGIALDTVLAFSPAGEARLRIPVDVQAQTSTHTLEVTMMRGSDPLFHATQEITLKRGETTPVEVALAAVTSTVSATGPSGPITAIGDTVVLTGSSRFATGDVNTAAPVSWTSSVPAVARVDAQGRVVALSEGSTKIIAASGAVSDTVDIVVAAVVTTLLLANPLDTLTAGFTRQLTAAPKDRRGNLLSRQVVWSSSDTAIATVDATGLVRARRMGSATISARVGTVTQQVVVTALPDIAQMIVSPASVNTLLIGESRHFRATLLGNANDTIQYPVTWTSSDTLVATVDSAGLVLVRRAGSTTITARALNKVVTRSVTGCGGPPPITGSLFQLRPSAGTFDFVSGTPMPGRFNGVNVLFAGGLIFGTDSTNTVVGFDARGLIKDTDRTAPVCKIAVPGGEYTRARPRITKPVNVPPVSILQETFTSGAGYVLLRYTFTNVGAAPIPALRVGMGFDWDMEFDGGATNDRTRFNPTINAAEAFEATGQMVGVASVSHPITYYDSPTNGGTNPDPASRGQYYTRLGSEISLVTRGPADIRQLIGFQEFSIPAGGSVSFVVALAGGLTASEFQDNVVRARASTGMFPVTF